METGEPGGMPTVTPKDEAEPKYEGKPGQTRLKAIHVPLKSGFVRTLAVYDVVNVGTDPKLGEAALAGALHRFETGEELAVPFVYHDPAEEKLVLVVPPALRHEVLKLRAALLLELAADTEAPIPSYARKAEAVIGHQELAAYLSAGPAPTAAEVARAEDLDIRDDALDQRESRLEARAEEVTRREDELRAQAEELEVGRADLAMRERELEARLELLLKRERATSAAAAEPASRAIVDAVVQLVDDEVEALDEVDELEPLETTPGRAADDLSQEVVLVDDEAEREPVSDVEDYVESVVDDEDDIEELDELEPIDTGINFRPEPGEAVSFVSEPPPRDATHATPSATPPPGFLSARHGPEAQAVVEAGGVRLFVKLPSGRADLFVDPAQAELLVQMVVVEECPVVLLVAVDTASGRPVALRAALDPRDEADHEVLEQLRRRFVARVSVFRAEGEYLHAIELAAPREANVARIIDRVARLRAAPGLDVATAVERVLSTPPPLRSRQHPFGGSVAPKNAAEAFKLIQSVAAWTTPEKMDLALLELSIPRGQVDAAVRAAIEAGLRFGLPLLGTLLDRALAAGLITDVSATVAQQVDLFREASTKLGRGGMSREDVASAWEALLGLAGEHEVAVDAETHEIAHRAIREVRGGVDEVAEIDPARLGELSPPDLLGLLDHPRFRKDAAIELASRQNPEHAEALCRAARKMSRAEVVHVVPKILALGDGAGDALIDALSARKTFVRQAFALSLGHLKLRRAVVPLVHLLASEESDVWREVARVTGSFGTASLRNVKRQLREPKGKESRYILTLAHLANHGCLKHVEKLTQDEKPAIATMAQEALAMRAEAKAIEDRVNGSLPIEGDDPVLRFSLRFQQELAGTAPEGDLA